MTNDAALSTPHDAESLIRFWRDAGPQRWFAKDADFDARFVAGFLALHEAAIRGALAVWSETANGALALTLLLDQFPRNAFRGTPRMFASDSSARDVAGAAIAKGFDRAVEPMLQGFFYLPFGHSEDPADQALSVALCERLGGPFFEHAKGHRDIIERFGRFPHRNPILGRETSADERRFLDDGGFAG